MEEIFEDWSADDYIPDTEEQEMINQFYVLGEEVVG